MLKDIKRVAYALALCWFLFWLTKPVEIARALTVININSGMTQSAIFSSLASTSGGGYDVKFAAGNYVFTSQATFPCAGGNIFEGPAVGFTISTASTDGGVLPSAIIAPTYSGGHAVLVNGGNNTYTTPGAGCTIQYMGFQNQNVYVSAPVSGFLFQYSNCSNIYGSISQTGSNSYDYACVYVSDDNSTQSIGFSAFFWNSFGPSCTDVDNAATDPNDGGCGGIILRGSNVNVAIRNNNVVGQIEEFFHTLAQGTNGNVSTNLDIEFNDIPHVHRISIELQQQITTGQTVQNNDVRDPYLPYLTSQALSEACCASANGAASGNPTVYNNAFIMNGACKSGAAHCPGMVIEAWGYNATFNSNLIQASTSGHAGISFGGSSTSVSSGLSATGNIIEGSFDLGAFWCEEDSHALPGPCQYAGNPVYSPNTVNGTPSQHTSTAPTISPAAGVKAYPLTVTLANAGTNTSTYYTTDGSTPVPGAVGTQLYAGPFVMSGPGTVNAVGMWGSGANTYSYASGWGYGPSSPQAATYSASSASPAGALRGKITVSGRITAN